jgi:MFS family permease
MVLVGFPLLALTYTNDPVLIAGVAVAGQVLAPVVALPVGALADRSSPRTLLVTVQVLQFVLLGSFAVCVATGFDSLAAIYVVSCLMGALTVAFDCASSAVVPRLVATSDLVKANARLDIVDVTGEEMVGRAVGGAAFAFARVVPFFADAVSFFVSAAIIRTALPGRAALKTKASLMTDLREGTRWFLQNPLVRLIGGVVAQLAFCQSMVLALLVLYAKEDLHLTDAGFGLLLGISAVGNVVGASAAHRVHVAFGSGWCIVLGGTLAALAYPLLAVTHSPATACAALAIETMAIVVGRVAAQSVRQASVPVELQGRVGSAIMTLIFIAMPLGALVGGLVADAIGIRHTILAAGLLQLAVLAITAPKLLSRLRTWHYPTGPREGTPAPTSYSQLPSGHGLHPAGDPGGV